MAAVFRRGVNDICALLGFYAAWNGTFLLTFRHNLSAPFTRLKLTLTLGDGTDKLLRNVRKQLPFTVRTIPKERRSHSCSSLQIGLAILVMQCLNAMRKKRAIFCRRCI